ncbi:hypothetical protein HOY80DRAFT_883261, partial [Tuber brumale]
GVGNNSSTPSQRIFIQNINDQISLHCHSLPLMFAFMESKLLTAITTSSLYSHPEF